jgi:hypothetical protein
MKILKHLYKKKANLKSLSVRFLFDYSVKFLEDNENKHGTHLSHCGTVFMQKLLVQKI